MVFEDDGGGAVGYGVGFGGEKAGGCVVGLLLLGWRWSVGFDDCGVARKGGLLGGKRSFRSYRWGRSGFVVVFAKFAVMVLGRT